MVISSSSSSIHSSNNRSITQATSLKGELQLSPSLYSSKLNDKIKLVTAGLLDHYVNLLKKQSSQNAETIADYVCAMNVEINPSIHHRTNQIRTLSYISGFHNQKPFLKMTRNDVLQYLDTHRNPEESDSLHNGLALIICVALTCLDFSNGYTTPK